VVFRRLGVNGENVNKHVVKYGTNHPAKANHKCQEDDNGGDRQPIFYCLLQQIIIAGTLTCKVGWHAAERPPFAANVRTLSWLGLTVLLNGKAPPLNECGSE
jgi:hypothetical protein